MAILPEEYQQMVLDRVGDTEDGLIQERMGRLWEMHSAIADLYLRYLYVSREAIDLLLGKVREQISFTNTAAGNEVTIKLQEKFTNLQQMRTNTVDQITAHERATDVAATQPVSGAAIGRIRQLAPTMFIGDINPNDRRWR